MIIERRVEHVQQKNRVRTMALASDRKRGPGMLIIGSHRCGYCRALLKEIDIADGAISQARRDRTGMPVYWIDGDREPTALQHFQGIGYPTIYWVDGDGKLSDRPYEGDRRAFVLYEKYMRLSS